MIARLRRWAMRTTDVTLPWAGSRAQVRFLYALWSRVYDTSIALDPAYRGNARRMVERVVEPGDRVLDVGVGTGILAEYGASRARDYVGIDYSGSMLSRAGLKMARGKLGSVSLRWADARSLPFEDAYFDAAVSSFVLPHFDREEKPRVLGEIARVLRPGGRLGLFLAQGEIAPLFSTRDELEDMLADAGFQDIEIEDRDDVYRIVSARKPGSQDVVRLSQRGG